MLEVERKWSGRRVSAIGVVLAVVTACALARPAFAVLVRGPYLQLATDSSIVIRWRTDIAGESHVSYGPAPAELTTTVVDPTATTEHEVALTGLVPATQYYYSVGSELGLLAGADTDHFFRTHPSAGSDVPLRIWAVGDSGGGNTGIGNGVRDAYLGFAASQLAQVFIALGDNAYNQGTDAEYTSRFFARYAPVLRNTPAWPTLGNHDSGFGFSDPVTQTGVFFDSFTLPSGGEAGGEPSLSESFYAFDYGDVHFVCLDSSFPGTSLLDAVKSWLQADLAARDSAWTIAYWHYAVYTKGSHDSDCPGTGCREGLFREQFNPILEANGVDLVLAGHSHVYERSMLIDGHYGLSSEFDPAVHARDTGDGDPAGDGAYRKPSARVGAHEGTVYVTNGVASYPKTGTLDHPVMIRSIGDTAGSVVIDIDGTRLDGYFVDQGGSVLDHFRIVKGAVSNVPAVELWASFLLAAGLLAVGARALAIRTRAGRTGFAMLPPIGSRSLSSRPRSSVG